MNAAKAKEDMARAKIMALEKKRMASNFTWPESESLSSGLACRALPLRGRGVLANALADPIVNLVDLSRPKVLVFSWALLAGIWAFLAYVAPVWTWNSSNGVTRNTSRAIIGALVLYYIVAFVLVAALNRSGCGELLAQARDYLYAPAPPIPPTLQTSAQQYASDLLTAKEALQRL